MPGRYGGSSNDDSRFVYSFDLIENNVNFVDGKFPGAIVNFGFSLLADREPLKFIKKSSLTLDLIPKFIPANNTNPARLVYSFADIEGQNILQQEIFVPEFSETFSGLSLIIEDRSDDPGFQFGFGDDLSTITFEQASGPAVSDINFIVDSNLLGAATNYSLNSDSNSFDPSLQINPSENVIRVQAEDYLNYFDTTPGNRFGAYRNDDVDIGTSLDFDNGFSIGEIAAGEWLSYDVDIPEDGLYQVVARVASAKDGSHQLDVSLAGQNTSIVIGNTGGWNDWINVTGDTLNLSAGSQELRFDMVSPDFNLNYVDLIAVDDNDSNFNDDFNSTNDFFPFQANSDLGFITLNETPLREDSFLADDIYENDVYKFTLDETSNLDIVLDARNPEDDADLELYRDSNNNGQLDSSDELLDYSDAPGSDDISYSGASADTYFAVVYYFDGGIDSLIDYDLSLSAF